MGAYKYTYSHSHKFASCGSNGDTHDASNSHGHICTYLNFATTFSNSNNSANADSDSDFNTWWWGTRLVVEQLL